MKRKRIFIVVINWNRADLTLACLKSISKSIEEDYVTITVVVDNNSSDNSVPVLRSQSTHFTLIQNKENLGWAGGNNAGIRHALKHGADAVFVLANDATVRPDTIKVLVDRLFGDDSLGIVGPKTYYPGKKNGKNIIADVGGMLLKHRYFGINRGQGEVDQGKYDHLTKPDYITGAAMLIKREVFEKVGLFDEKLFIYYEDVDFCFRAKKARFHLLMVSDAVIHHLFAATTKIGSPVHHYYTTRNHYLFVEKHAPLSVKLREWLRTPKTVYEFLRSADLIKKKYSLLGIRDYYFRRFGKRTYW